VDIHRTALVSPQAEIDPTVTIGPYTVIESDVRIGARTRIGPHVYIASGTTLAPGCHVHAFASLGDAPQDVKYGGEPSYVQVGEATIIREHVSIHRGTEPGSTTIVGRRCFLMATSHVAHNCVLGDDVKMANSAVIAGHSQIGDGAFLSGNVSVHQFCRIGELVMVGGGATVTADVPPFLLVTEDRRIHGVNLIGLRRAGFAPAERDEIRDCFRLLYRSGLPLPRAIDRIDERVQTDPGRRLLAFLRAPAHRGIIRARGAATED
jgi:UDP-N-acetylglucosamine acyltransferase